MAQRGAASKDAGYMPAVRCQCCETPLPTDSWPDQCPGKNVFMDTLDTVQLRKHSLQEPPCAASTDRPRAGSVDLQRTSLRLADLRDRREPGACWDSPKPRSYTLLVRDLQDITQEKVDIQHPLCSNCVDTLIKMMDDENNAILKEIEDFQRYIDAEPAPDDGGGLDELRAELQSVQAKNQEVIDGIHSKLADMTRLDAEIEAQEKANQTCLVAMRDSWIELESAEDEEISARTRLEYATQRAASLRGQNAFHATFKIDVSRRIGKINGHRLGRLPDQPVEWEEINIAWGQAAHLLTSLARSVNVLSSFAPYRIVPLGNLSYIEQTIRTPVPSVKRLPLYKQSDDKPKGNSPFDDAMVGFLHCLNMFDRSIAHSMPHKIFHDAIGDGEGGNVCLILFDRNAEAKWTLALKCVLGNLQFALDHLELPATAFTDQQ